MSQTEEGSDKRGWLYGHIAGIGNCLFRVDDADLLDRGYEFIDVRNITVLQPCNDGSMNLLPWPPVGNLYKDVLTVRRDAITYHARPVPELEVKAGLVWGGIRLASSMPGGRFNGR